MIRFANDSDNSKIRDMWATCFGDTGEFIELYFRTKYKPENTLLYYCDDKPVASLQMLLYSITFYGSTIPFYYMSGLCTLPEYRKRGIMGKLIEESHNLIAQRNVDLAILVPANETLSYYYNQFDYENTFLTSNIPLFSLRSILESTFSMEAAYSLFCKTHCSGNLRIQRTFDDFLAIVEDGRLFNFPDKFNLPGMTRIINPEKLLIIFAKYNKSLKFNIKIEGIGYHVEEGSVQYCQNETCDIEANLRLFTQLIFGYKTNELGEKITSIFPEQNPIINFMME